MSQMRPRYSTTAVDSLLKTDSSTPRAYPHVLCTAEALARLHLMLLDFSLIALEGI